MSANNSFANNGAGAMEPPVPTLQVIVDHALGDEALTFEVKGFKPTFTPEDLEVELMGQLYLSQPDAGQISRDICNNKSVFLIDFVAFELFSEHGSFVWPDEDVD
jgi:hypothetical protein